MALDKFGRENGLEFGRETCSSHVAEGLVGEEKYVLAKPQTFMNRSGSAVVALAKKFSAKPGDIVVVHDDIDIALGAIREKTGGGAGGHNGVSDIAERLGTPEFRRIRIGVGRPPEGHDVADYVLSPFRKEEKPLVEKAIEEFCKRILRHD
jgi:PTH1 family peptidyl-tRNA hydrolase